MRGRLVDWIPRLGRQCASNLFAQSLQFLVQSIDLLLLAVDRAIEFFEQLFAIAQFHFDFGKSGFHVGSWYRGNFARKAVTGAAAYRLNGADFGGFVTVVAGRTPGIQISKNGELPDLIQGHCCVKCCASRKNPALWACSESICGVNCVIPSPKATAGIY